MSKQKGRVLKQAQFVGAEILGSDKRRLDRFMDRVNRPKQADMLSKLITI